MSSPSQETEGDSLWLSPDASQKLLNEYQLFLDDYDERLRNKIGKNNSEESIQNLCEKLKNENNTWIDKLQFCDPDTFDAFMNEREAMEREDRLKSVSPEVKDIIIALDATTERIKLRSAEQAWKHSLMENSHKQIELLENLKGRMDAIIEFQKDLADHRRGIGPNWGVIILCCGVAIFVIFLIVKIFKAFF